MSGQHGINTASTVLIHALSAYINTIQDKLNANTSSDMKGTWVGENPPTDTSKYQAWVSLDEEDFDLYFNVGTESDPIWASPLKPGPAGNDGQPGGNVIEIPEVYGIPYQTNTKIGDSIVWAVRLEASPLPDSNILVVNIPTNTVVDWDSNSAWIETSKSFVRTDSGRVLNLPYINVNDLSKSIQVELNLGGTIEIITTSDYSLDSAVVTLNYTKLQ